MLFAFLLLDVILLAFVLFPEGFRLKGWQPDYLRQLGEGAIVYPGAVVTPRRTIGEESVVGAGSIPAASVPHLSAICTVLLMK